jgi:SIR2-like domain
VTTNYDQVLECLLSGNSVSLGPNDVFTSSNGVIPIFHLHGARTAPEDIIITQEDYVALFRPAEYRQIRLALTIKESTTCLLGYGLGDVNVLTALDWSKNVYEKERGDYPHEVIQIVRTKDPRPDPYRSNDGIVIVEASEISDFCEEYVTAAAEWKKGSKQKRGKLKEIVNLLAASEPETIKRFIDDDSWRRGVSESACQVQYRLSWRI